MIVLAVCAIVALAGSWKVSGLIRSAHAGNVASTALQADDARSVVHQWKVDRVRRKRVGTASFYASRFDGRTMADGTPMKPHGNNAASRTLPLGTTAMVTNLETGRTAIVTIRDRGPYVGGRIVDLSPGTARKIGLTPRKGLAKVEVAPLEVPMPDGTIKPGLSDSEARTEDLRLARVASLTPQQPGLAQLNP
ncbi:MAG TPA: septal ring lytic transglycosylase RlpA family protein [Steroidobacteraceae bacterium]|nr:septal ring lytic transglycosylase RlpA family protein [Steroidobacteraceae bacterium]